MNAFEEIVKPIFEHEGYWCRSREMVTLTKKQKININKKTLPSVELDIIAFNPKRDECLVIEVKFYLNSHGVMFKDLKKRSKIEGRYKMFTNQKYKNEIFRALKKKLLDDGMINKSTKIRSVLVAGKISGATENEFEAHSLIHGYEFYGPKKIYNCHMGLCKRTYVNDHTIMLLKFIEQVKENEIKSNKVKKKT